MPALGQRPMLKGGDAFVIRVTSVTLAQNWPALYLCDGVVRQPFLSLLKKDAACPGNLTP